MLSEEFIRGSALVLATICVACFVLVIGVIYLFARFSDSFFPMLRPTQAKMNEAVEVWRSRCVKLKEENERLQAHVQQLIESGKQDQERIRASFPKPKGEFDTEDDG
jgi:hypothetical protein